MYKKIKYLYIVHCTLYISQKGQAAVEFVVALIALLLIISGGVFLFELNRTQRDMAVEMRADAGVEALRGGRGENLDYIEGWEDNGRPRLGQAANFNLLANFGARESADFERVEDLLSENTSNTGRGQLFLVLNKNPMPMSSLGFVRESKSGEVPVESVIRQLVIPRESVTVTHEVVLPSVSGLY